MTRTLLLLAATFAFAAPAVLAQPPRRGPPPEAVAACEGQEEGDVCEFAGRGGTAEGTCQMHQALVCVPAGHEDRRPPRER